MLKEGIGITTERRWKSLPKYRHDDALRDQGRIDSLENVGSV
jgi:hypothetical protein